jgi:protein arginine phosphatase
VIVSVAHLHAEAGETFSGARTVPVSDTTVFKSVGLAIGDLAAGLPRELARNDPRFRPPAVEVSSAGTTVRSGDEANQLAVMVMKRRGIDLTGYRATRLSPGVKRRSDVILTLTRVHKESVLRVDPSARARTFTLAEFAGGGSDVDDPLREGTEAAYERCAEELMNRIPRVQEWLGAGEPLPGARIRP